MFRPTTGLVALALLMAPFGISAEDDPQPTTGWQTPPKEVLEVLHAPNLPWVYVSPTGEYLLVGDPVVYPPLSELAAPMHKLAGMRVNPVVNHFHGRHGATSPL